MIRLCFYFLIEYIYIHHNNIEVSLRSDTGNKTYCYVRCVRVNKIYACNIDENMAKNMGTFFFNFKFVIHQHEIRNNIYVCTYVYPCIHTTRNCLFILENLLSESILSRYYVVHIKVLFLYPLLEAISASILHH